MFKFVVSTLITAVLTILSYNYVTPYLPQAGPKVEQPIRAEASLIVGSLNEAKNWQLSDSLKDTVIHKSNALAIKISAAGPFGLTSPSVSIIDLKKTTGNPTVDYDFNSREREVIVAAVQKVMKNCEVEHSKEVFQKLLNVGSDSPKSGN